MLGLLWCSSGIFRNNRQRTREKLIEYRFGKIAVVTRLSRTCIFEIVFSKCYNNNRCLKAVPMFEPLIMIPSSLSNRQALPLKLKPKARNSASWENSFWRMSHAGERLPMFVLFEPRDVNNEPNPAYHGLRRMSSVSEDQRSREPAKTNTSVAVSSCIREGSEQRKSHDRIPFTCYLTPPQDSSPELHAMQSPPPLIKKAVNIEKTLESTVNDVPEHLLLPIL